MSRERVLTMCVICRSTTVPSLQDILVPETLLKVRQISPTVLPLAPC